MTFYSLQRTEEASAAGFGALTVSRLVQAVEEAATKAAAHIADSTGREAAQVSAQLNDAVWWLTEAMCTGAHATPWRAAPMIARDHADLLRGFLLEQLHQHPDVEGAAILHAMRMMEEVAQSWRRSNRGRFMARLSGSHGEDAVVAVAHDVRSPLSSILILVDSLRRSSTLGANPIQDRQLALIYGAAHELSTLASDLIDGGSSRQLLLDEAAPFSVTETMLSVSRIVRPISEEKSVSLRLSPPNVDARVGHAAALQRVLLNLTTNALRCTDTGTVTISCTEMSITDVEFSVADTGRGIPAKHLDVLSERFEDKNSPRPFSSAGLGLVIVTTLLDAMGGTLRVQANGEQGTRFSFRLKLPAVR